MNKPKWQRTRIVRQKPSRHSVVGKELCTTIEHPCTRLSIPAEANLATAIPKTSYNTLLSNLIDERGVKLILSADFIELLARDDKDFAEDVPLVNWEDWLAQGVTNGK